MSFPAIPPSPSSSASSGGPHTPEIAGYPSHLALPVLPDLDGRLSNLDGYDDNSAGGVKRTLKMKQRANTAERRASHNAVERQRREALNARFLDLAAVLPNLANVRRPSKSSIVNSSIAHVHASRRHRILASQQLRLLASECDSLRREANEWRARAGVMRLDTPSRGETFSNVIGEELHYETADATGPTARPVSLRSQRSSHDDVSPRRPPYAVVLGLSSRLGGSPVRLRRCPPAISRPLAHDRVANFLRQLRPTTAAPAVDDAARGRREVGLHAADDASTGRS
ncbi:hypothetical protein K438DRAFT_210493 [Mycena galopus ATCC 62051]|nr:hypothetical protein K438DRAFT_210493 [Mycena galopus ATCC 62051]